MRGERRTHRAAARALASVAAWVGVAASLPSCANDVGADVPPGVVVATYRAPGVDLGARRTFAIVSSVGVVSNDPAATPVASPALLAAVAEHLESRGFVKAAEVDPTSPLGGPVAADLAVNVTALEVDGGDGAGRLALPGHAQPDAWGFPGYAWTYGWSWAPLEVTPGTIVVEIADLAGVAPAGASGPAPLGVGWAAFAYGAALLPTQYDTPLVLDSVDRAFAQSPYLVVTP